MAAPKASYPKGTTFQTRINQNGPEKERVADHLVSTFLGEGQSAFISDGSSTFFVALSLYAWPVKEFRIYTNSLPIAHEFPLWTGIAQERGFRVLLAGGEVNPSLMMIGGDTTCGEVTNRMANRAQWCILSTHFFFGDRGPAGREPDSLAIKQAALQSAQRVILIADHSKFSVSYKQSTSLVYTDREEWKDLLKRNSTYVLTTLPPGKSTQDMHDLGRQITQAKRQPPSTPATDPAWFYASNTWLLRQEMRDRFIELP